MTSGSGRAGTLIVAPGWVGDVVMCHALVQVVAARWPGEPVDVLAPAWARPLLARMPEVRGVLDAPDGHGRLDLRALFGVAREVRRRAFRRAIVTRRSFKSALVPWLAGIPTRTGTLGESRYGLINDRRAVDGASHPHAVVRFAVLGMPAGARPTLDEVPWPRLRADEERGRELESRLGVSGGGPLVALAPGAAFGPAKRWPAERWSELARRLAEGGRRVVVVGGASEQEAGRELAGAHARVIDLTGRTSLDEVLDLMARTDAVVSNDSGLMHLAAAAGTRVVAIFGSSSPINTPPLSPDATVFWRALACSPCFERECPLGPGDGHLDCLRGIGVDEVLSSLTGAAHPRPSEWPAPTADLSEGASP